MGLYRGWLKLLIWGFLVCPCTLMWLYYLKVVHTILEKSLFSQKRGGGYENEIK